MLRANGSEGQRRAWLVATAVVVLLISVECAEHVAAIDARSAPADVAPGQVAAGDADRLVPFGCGNGQIDAGEECDDGGLCIGGPNAGAFCTADSLCPDGTCKTFGGDGCATNCTLETDVAFYPVPGVSQGLEIVPGTSGAVVYSDVFTIPVPFSGTETLTIGKERNGQIPVVVKAAAVHLARVLVGEIVCFCPRALAAKTCGGTLFEPDGMTLSADCTPGFSAGDSVCQGKNPCAFVHGPGNSAAGVIGCDGLDGVNVSLTQDSGGSSGMPEPPRLTLSGAGGAGSAVLFATTALGGFGTGQRRIPGLPCTGTDPSVYGPDGELCTDDDPQSRRGTPITAVATTGTVTGHLLNANQTDGDDIGPFTATGAPFRCGALQRGDASGAALASTFTELNRPTLGDVLFTSALVASGSAGLCVGDCGNSGDVTVNEIITLVSIALGNTHHAVCPHGVSDRAGVNVALIIEALNNALDGCPLPPTPTPTLTPTLTPTRPTPSLTPTINRTPPTPTPKLGNCSTTISTPCRTNADCPLGETCKLVQPPTPTSVPTRTPTRTPHATGTPTAARTPTVTRTQTGTRTPMLIRTPTATEMPASQADACTVALCSAWTWRRDYDA